MNKMKFSGSAVFGIILIAVGVISLLSGLRYFNSWDIFSTYWPLVIVLFGVRSLVDHRSSTAFGIVVVAVGVFLQIDTLGLWYLGNINVRELIVPMVIILIGLNFVLPKRKEESKKVSKADGAVESQKVSKSESVDEVIVESKEVVEKAVEPEKSVEVVVEQETEEEAPQEESDATLTETTEEVKLEEELPEA